MLSIFENLKLTFTGESHSQKLTFVLEGIPDGEKIDLTELQAFCDRRKSGRYAFSTPRVEDDKVVITSGIKDGAICGAVTGEIANNNVKPSDYSFYVTPRPSHADYVSAIKYGDKAAKSGGGRFSGRMTALICAAGGIAKQYLQSRGVRVGAYVSSLAAIDFDGYKTKPITYDDVVKSYGEKLPVLNGDKVERALNALSELAARGDTAGGIIDCIAFGLPVGLGDALEYGLEGRIAASVYAIPAVKGVEFGSGFAISRMSGITANDAFEVVQGKIRTRSNNSGGINGGISNGMPLTLSVAFRPTPSVAAKQQTVNLQTLQNTELTINGRHDVAFLPRAVAVVEAAVSLTLADAYITYEA